MQAPEDDPRRLVRLIRAIFWLLQRQTGFEGKSWTEGALPSSGRAYLVVDGFASSSTKLVTRVLGRTLIYTPWLDEIRTAILRADKHGIPCGFSYSKRRRHYGPRNTNIPIRQRGVTLFQRYTPLLNVNQRVVYLGFSRGAALLSLGLCKFLTNLPQSAKVALSTFVPAVVLVQPTLALHEPYIKAAKLMHPRDLPTPFREFIRFGQDMQDQMLGCIEQIIETGIEVFLIYWDNDRFLAYPDDFKPRLEAVGVDVRPLELPSDATIDPFVEHCNVKSQQRICEEVEAVLRQLG